MAGRGRVLKKSYHFPRFSVVLEYEEKPVLPAPLTIFSHFYRVCKYFYRRCRGKNTRFESGLKLFLSRFDMERLYDFEEECVEGMLKERDLEFQVNKQLTQSKQSADTCVYFYSAKLTIG